MNTGWLLMGACLIFGGEDSPNKNAHGMEQVKGAAGGVRGFLWREILEPLASAAIVLS